MRLSAWRRSSYCANGECVEVAFDGSHYLVRSTRRRRVIVRYTPEEWQAFTLGVKAGEFG